MAIFDNLQQISVGQYSTQNSPLHRLVPQVKIIAYFMLMMAITLTRSFYGLISAIAIIILFLLLSKTSLTNALKKLLVPLPAILAIALLQLFIAPRSQGERIYFSFWIFTISLSGLQAAFLLFARFVGLVWLFTLAGATISNVEMIDGFDLIFRPLGKLGIQTYALTMVLQMTLRFIPYLVFNAEKIAKSQAARGAKWDDPQGNLFQRVKQILPVLVPLFSISLQQADTLARAMVARGYGTSNQRTGLREYRITPVDILFLILCLSAAALIFWLP